MFQWLKDHWEILRLSLKHPLLFMVFTAFQAAAILLGFFHPPAGAAPFLDWFTGLPWYGWVIGWLVVLWMSTLEYSVERKKRFDAASVNFFRAYVEFLLKDGHQLFQRAGGKDFYSKISEWQQKAVQGIAIGLGPEQSKDFFQRVEAKSPLSEAYRESTASKSDEPLSRCLQARLEELNAIRLSLPEKEGEGKKELMVEGIGNRERVPVQPAGLLTGEVEKPPAKRLPPR